MAKTMTLGEVLSAHQDLLLKKKKKWSFWIEKEIVFHGLVQTAKII